MDRTRILGDCRGSTAVPRRSSVATAQFRCDGLFIRATRSFSQPFGLPMREEMTQTMNERPAPPLHGMMPVYGQATAKLIGIHVDLRVIRGEIHIENPKPYIVFQDVTEHGDRPITQSRRIPHIRSGRHHPYCVQ